MRNEQPATINQFSGNLTANILAKTPIIGIDYRNTDKYTIYSMLIGLLPNLKTELWLYGIDKNNRPCITQFNWNGKPKVIDLFSFIPKREQTADGMEADEIILNYVLPRMGANNVFAFFGDNFEEWIDIQTQLAEKAQELGQTVLVLADGIDERDITPRLKKIGFFLSHWFPKEKELALYLGQRFKQKEWEGVELALGDEEIRRIASLLTGCDFLEAEKKFSVFAIKHYLKNRHEKKLALLTKA